jgi:hypothetical protein
MGWCDGRLFERGDEREAMINRSSRSSKNSKGPRAIRAVRAVRAA